MAKRFRWRLEPVKKAKKREEERCYEELARAQGVVLAEEAELVRLQALREQTTHQLHEKQSGRLVPSELAQTHAYLKDLHEKIRLQTEKLGVMRSVALEKRGSLMEKMKERKVLENLEDRDRARQRKVKQRKTQKADDETANRRSTQSQNPFDLP